MSFLKLKIIAKNTVYFVLFLILSLGFTGCTKKETDEEEYQNRINFLVDLYWDDLLYKNEDDSENTKYIKSFLTSQLYGNGEMVYMVENLLPERKGILDCKDVYTCCDDASWVDDVILNTKIEDSDNESDELEDAEDIEEDGEESEEKTSEEKTSADSEKKEEKQVDSEELKAIKDVIENSKKKEKYILNKSNELKYLKFDSELLMPSIYADNSIVIEKNEKELNRKLYDDYFRLKLVETWNISTVIDSKIIKTEKYEYKENTQICIKKEEKTDNMLKIYEYNEKGYVEKTSETEIYKDKEYPLKKTEIKYDDENRVIEESTTENFYKDKKDRIPDKITKTKYKYSYNNENNIPPDFEYFENGELKMKNVYSNIKGTYTSKIFFDDSFAVTTYYEDEIRKKDVYTMNGVEKRVEVYE